MFEPINIKVWQFFFKYKYLQCLDVLFDICLKENCTMIMVNLVVVELALKEDRFLTLAQCVPSSSVHTPEHGVNLNIFLQNDRSSLT